MVCWMRLIIRALVSKFVVREFIIGEEETSGCLEQSAPYLTESTADGTQLQQVRFSSPASSPSTTAKGLAIADYRDPHTSLGDTRI